MTQQEFDYQISRLKSAFGDSNFDPERVQMIKRLIDLQNLPPVAFVAVVTGFISKRKRSDPPLPQDFALALKWRQAATKAEALLKEPYPPKCIDCLDVGIVETYLAGTKTLAKCSCENGTAQPWKLPVVDPGQANTPLDWKEFKPKSFAKTEAGIKKAILEKQEWWRFKITIAEEFWKNVKQNLGATSGPGSNTSV